jgi:hypothetical protein
MLAWLPILSSIRLMSNSTSCGASGTAGTGCATFRRKRPNGAAIHSGKGNTAKDSNERAKLLDFVTLLAHVLGTTLVRGRVSTAWTGGAYSAGGATSSAAIGA